MIASSLDPKKKKKMALAEKAGEDKLSFLFNDFVESHKILAKSAKEEIMSDDNKKLFEKKKKELTKLAKSYKKEAEKVIENLKQQAIDKAKEGQEKGEIISKKNAKFIASRYMSGLSGLIVTIQSGVTQEVIDDLVESVKEIVE